MSVIVHYHGDGGQACILAQKTFTDTDEAIRFATACLNELGHYCERSVWLEGSEAREVAYLLSSQWWELLRPDKQ